MFSSPTSRAKLSAGVWAGNSVGQFLGKLTKAIVDLESAESAQSKLLSV